MQRKTLSKVITKKLEDWLDSITDAQLRKDVKKSLLVSGGSITSLFLNEKVNDYDIYIQSMDVLVRLANYYAPGKVLDGRLIAQYIEERKRDNGYSEDADMGKEFVRIKTLKNDQVKLDIPSGGQRTDLTGKEDVPAYEVVFLSQNAISLSADIQIVLRFSGTPAEIHKNFDFIHATNYFTFEHGLVTNIAALESTLTKELRYQGSLYPLTSIVRMKKFIGRGWRINAGEMLKMMFQISELDLTDVEVLEEQLIGVDVAYFSTLIEILRGVDKDKITSSYLNTIIDKVFNHHSDEDEND